MNSIALIRGLVCALLVGCSDVNTQTPETTGLAPGVIDTDKVSDTIPPEAPAKWTLEVLTTGLDDPFEIAQGPDDALWVTERTGRQITRVAPDTGAKITLLNIDEVLVTPGTQDGLLGLALDLDLSFGKAGGEIYVAYTYDADLTAIGEQRRVKIVRYTYDAAEKSFRDPRVLLSGLPGSTEHNSGRLTFGPDAKLYYTIGDQGNNQFDHTCRPNLAQRLPTRREVEAQDWTAYQGKVLRLELDGSIPADNPMLDSVVSHVWSYGHRNAQGLAFADGGTLYLTEHGPKSDDELNIIVAGRNYGWPYVSGYRDDRAYVYANWAASIDPTCDKLVFSDFVIPASVPQREETAWRSRAFRPPAMTFYTVPDSFDFLDPHCAEGGLYYICWPTIAPSSVTWYGDHQGGIAQLRNSLLITSLKLGTLYQVQLHSDDTPKSRDPVALFTSVDRYRDASLSADGATIYIATDSAGNAMKTDGTPTAELAHPGAILTLRLE